MVFEFLIFECFKEQTKQLFFHLSKPCQQVVRYFMILNMTLVYLKM